MLPITRQDVVLAHPELAQVDAVATANKLEPVDVWTKLINDADLEIRKDQLTTEQRNRMGIELVGHFAWSWLQSAAGTNPNGTAGPVTQVSVGGVSKSFAAPEAWTANAGVLRAQLATTRYGKEFLRLGRLFLGIPFATAGQAVAKPGALAYPDWNNPEGIDTN